MIFLVVVALVSLSILVHEAGHALAARLCGLQVPVFSLGFGKPLYAFRLGETEYRIGWLPLGGFVQLPTREDFAVFETTCVFEDLTLSRRLAILLAGPLVSLVLATALFPLGMWVGRLVPDYYNRPARVGAVKAHSPVEGRLQPGDRLVAVNGVPVATWREANRLAVLNRNCNLTVQKTDGSPVRLDLGESCGLGLEPLGVLPDWGGLIVAAVETGSLAERLGLGPGDRIVAAGKRRAPLRHPEQLERMAQRDTGGGRPLQLWLADGRTLAWMPTAADEGADWQREVGVRLRPPVTLVRFGLFEGLAQGIEQAALVGRLVLRGLADLLTSRVGLLDLGGIVSAVVSLKQATASGSGMMLMLLGFLNLQLALFNLLPVPGLDGGQAAGAVLTHCCPGLSGSHLSRWAVRLGLLLVFGVLAWGLVLDGVRLILGRL